MEKIKTKLQSLVLIGYSLIIFYLISSGLFIKFIHPRMQIYTLLCAIYIDILALVDINKPAQDNKMHISNIIYVVPLILIFYINNGNFSSKMLDSKSNNALLREKSNQNDDVQNNNISQDNTSDNIDNSVTDINNDIASDENNIDNQENTIDNIVDNQNEQYAQENEQDDNITKDQNPNSETKVNGFDFYFTDKNYLDNLMLISEDTDKYIGKTVSFNGFVYRDDTMSSDQFVVGRLGIWCCIADASLSGFLCTYEDAEKYKENDWYIVEGTLDKTNTKDEYTGEYYTCPYVHVTKMQKIDKPDNEYVYPS